MDGQCFAESKDKILGVFSASKGINFVHIKHGKGPPRIRQWSLGLLQDILFIR